jgi:peptide/nickel transport system substrate-binding protein
VLAACGGEGGEGGSAAGSSDTLTVALPGWTPQSFDLPTNCSSPIYELAYEPLIRVSSTGEYEPGIAESWEYSDNNTVFTMKIRDGIKFADGTDVTVDSVVDTLNYYKSVPGLNENYIKPLTIEADGEDSVRISSEAPSRVMELLFSSDGACNNGLIISEAGLSNPEKLKTEMFGAGPYQYVASESEPGDHYTYTPNPNYYDKSRQNWEKIVLRVIGDANTAFNALATGQVQVNMTGGETLLPQAESKGFDVTEGVLWGLSMMVWDRGGEVTEALADERVRQAMALALDRDSIAKTVGPATEPHDQFALPGLTGADPDLPSKYTHDVDQAKQLMADAGYADGFSTTMLVNSDDINAANAISAAVEQLAQIGVDVTLKSSPEGTFYSDIATREYPLGTVSWGVIGDVPFNADRLYKLPYSAVWNPFASVDPDLDKAHADLAAADESTVEDKARHFNDLMTSKAWYIPISYSPQLVYSKGIDVGTPGPLGEFDVASWKPLD